MLTTNGETVTVGIFTTYGITIGETDTSGTGNTPIFIQAPLLVNGPS